MVENDKTRVHTEDSKFSKHSQNSQVLSKVGTFELKYNEKPLKKQSFMDGSKSGKQSRNSQKDTCIKVTEESRRSHFTIEAQTVTGLTEE